MFSKFKNKFIGSKSFHKKVIYISLPVALQAFLATVAQLVDNVMVGRLGGDVVAGVGASNQIFFILMLIFFGISGGGQIYISQFKGANNDAGIKSSFHSTFILIFAFSFIGFAVVNIFAHQLLSVFLEAPEVIAIGVTYIKISSFTYFLYAITTAYAVGFRAITRAKIPMYISFLTVITNSILNYFLIFGFNFGFFNIEPMGYIGAAYATVISRGIETSLIITVSFLVKTNIRTNFIDLFKIDKEIFSKVFYKATPLTINEFFWSLGQTTMFILYSQKITNNITSFTIAYTFLNLFFVLMSAVATSVSIILGNDLGDNNIEVAKENSYKLLGFSFLVSLATVVFIYLSRGLVPILYKVNPDVIKNTQQLMGLMGTFFPIYFLTATCFYILRSGGDIKSVLLMDTVYSWTIVIPTCYLLRSILGVPLITSFAIIQVLEVVKLLLGFRFVTKNKWAKNIT